MNVTQKVREAATGRYAVQLVAAAAFGYALGGFAVAFLAVTAALAVPSIVSTIAYFWTRSAEWVKLGITEDYGQAALKKMEAASRKSLRETLDSIGAEALDEVERAIERREEQSGE